MSTDLIQAQCMIDLFASVGTHSFAVANIDINENRIWPLSYHRSIGKAFARRDDAHFTARALQQAIPHMLQLSDRRKRYTLPDGRAADAGENLIIRPISEDTVFVQLDDLSAGQLERVRAVSFLIVATSPGNHQAWIAVSAVEKANSKEFVRRVRKAVGGVDKSASGAVRLAGSFNWKLKYLPEPPIVSIVHGIPGRVMTADQLQHMGLLAEPEPVVATPPVQSFVHKVTSGHGRMWPDYARCLAGAPPSRSGNGPDRSLADYTWCKFAAQRGWSVEEIAAELPNVSEKARERIAKRDPGYVTETAKNGAAAAERGRQRSRA
jgi:hypothetical protein